MSGWNPFLRPTGAPARLFMGAVFAGVVPFPRQFSRPRSGEAESIQTIPITLPKCLLEGGHLRSGEDGEGAFTDSCADRGRGAVRPWHNCCAGADHGRARSPAGLRHRGAAGLVRAQQALWASPPPKADPPGSPPRTDFPYFCALIRWRRATQISPRRIIATRDRSVYRASPPYGICLRPLQGFVLGRQGSRLRRRGLRRRPLGRRPAPLAAASMAASRALSLPTERRASRASRISWSGAGPLRLASWLSFCTKSSGSLRLTAP